MRFNYYRIIYFNIILIALFWLNQIYLFFLILIWKLPYFLNEESDIEYQFNFQTATIEDVGASYLENDIDNDLYYTLQHMQSYLYSNCRFFFDVLGGELTLDYVDFIDFTIYKVNDNYINLNRNYKYIYNNKILLTIFKKFNVFKMYTILEDVKNNNYTNNSINYLHNFVNNNKKYQHTNNINILKDIKNIIKCKKYTLYDKQIKLQEKIKYDKQQKKRNNRNRVFMLDKKNNCAYKK